MGKFTKLFSSASLVVVLSTGVAAAQTNINNTGPGSSNTITNNSTNKVDVICINNSLVSNASSQSATSGGASSSGNTSGGSATSGSSSNQNNVTVTVNGSCPSGTTAAPAGSPAAQAAAGGRGGLSFDQKGNLVAAPGGGAGAGGAGAGAGGQGGQGGAVLPATGVDDTLKAAGFATAGLVGVAALSQVGFGIFRRHLLSK